MKRVYLAIAVLMIMAVAVTAYAFGPGPGRGERGGGCWYGNASPVAGTDEGFGPGNGRRGERMAQALGLTADQRSQLQGIGKRHFTQTKAIRDDLFQKRVEMKGLFANATTDEAAITAKAKEIGVLQDKLRDDMVQLRLEERRVLTPDQLQRLSQIRPGFRRLGRAKSDV